LVHAVNIFLTVKTLCITAAIDTTPPKSMALSIKKRDQVKRDAVIKHMKTQAMQRRINKPPNQVCIRSIV